MAPFPTTNMTTQFVVTPWRDGKELLEVRACLFRKDGDEDRRDQAVNKIFTWRLRKHQIPLLLESTADIIDVMLQEEKHGLEHNALRLLYASAVSRFVTGLSDSLTDFSRMRPSFFSPGQALPLPLSLVETRHCIVHRILPSLAKLKSAARESLDWLWEWYWSHLETAFSTKPKNRVIDHDPKTSIQALLKSYIRSRKLEIKSSRTNELSKAAKTAAATYTDLLTMTDLPSTQQHLLDALISETAILPSDKKFGSSMSGAFLIWTPFLVLLFSSPISPSSSHLHFVVIERLMLTMNSTSPFGVSQTEDPIKEGMCAWLNRILTHDDFARVRAIASIGAGAGTGTSSHMQFVETVLGILFSAPTFWNLRVAELVLDTREQFPAREAWMQVLSAARGGDNSEEEMELDSEGQDVDIEEMVQEELEAEAEAEMEMESGNVRDQDVCAREKERGPRKWVGLWRPSYIGALPVGWEVDQ